MPYPDLPPSETFWQCPACGSRERFEASGVGNIRCSACGRSSTVEQLKAAHSPTSTAGSPPTPSPAPSAR